MGRSLASASLLAVGLLIAGTVDAQQSAAPSPSAATPLDGATYTVRLRDIENKVDELKENLRRSQARLTLLSDTVLSGGASGCRAEIDFVNDISSGLDLVGVTITIDGVVQLNKQDENGALMASRTYPVLRAAVQPGDHTVQVKLSYRGEKGGLFSYMSAFRADVKGSHTFAASEGKVVRLKVMASERGGFFSALEQRLGLEWPETSDKLQSEALTKAEGATP
jgi:hypothetical protein